MIDSNLPRRALLMGMGALAALPRSATAAAKANIETANLRVEFDDVLRSRIVARFDRRETPLGDFSQSEFLDTGSA
jgi:hypothetical protein